MIVYQFQNILCAKGDSTKKIVGMFLKLFTNSLLRKFFDKVDKNLKKLELKFSTSSGKSFFFVSKFYIFLWA